MTMPSGPPSCQNPERTSSPRLGSHSTHFTGAVWKPMMASCPEKKSYLHSGAAARYRWPSRPQVQDHLCQPASTTLPLPAVRGMQWAGIQTHSRAGALVEMGSRPQGASQATPLHCVVKPPRVNDAVALKDRVQHGRAVRKCALERAGCSIVHAHCLHRPTRQRQSPSTCGLLAGRQNALAEAAAAAAPQRCRDGPHRLTPSQEEASSSGELGAGANRRLVMPSVGALGSSLPNADILLWRDCCNCFVADCEGQRKREAHKFCCNHARQ